MAEPDPYLFVASILSNELVGPSLDAYSDTEQWDLNGAAVAQFASGPEAPPPLRGRVWQKGSRAEELPLRKPPVSS
jgi:hypothetical protein